MKSATPHAGPGSDRVVALDVLRGFDMFWILGMEELAAALGKASGAPWAQGFAYQIDHASWVGFHFLDLIFPMFVFIAGASLVFSLGKSMARDGRSGAVRKLITRAVILFAWGIFCYGGISKGIDGIRWLGVLQRIAICGCVAGLAFVYLKERGRLVLLVSLLLGYWALMNFVPVPGVGAGNLAEGMNLANYVDSQWLPGFKWDGNHDPEGLLSTLPAIGTCLLGVMAGEYLKRADRTAPQKAAGLLVAGAALTVAGWLWHFQFPVIKKLWTSSYVLVAGGYSAMFLGAFYYLTDIRQWRAWATPFIWIGMNPITLYLSHHFLDYEKVAERIAGGPIAASFGLWGEVWMAVVMLGLAILLAWLLFRNRIFLRV